MVMSVHARALSWGPRNSLTILYRVLEICRNLSLEKVNISVNYVIWSVISFVKVSVNFSVNLPHNLLENLILHDFKAYDLPLHSYHLRKFLKIVQSCTGFLEVTGPSEKVALIKIFWSGPVRILYLQSGPFGPVRKIYPTIIHRSSRD